ncbi:MAG: hypothetical protein CM15mP74_25570 [Halieaceae bacterium]|nr:MAG: hypothetical protein CM15mP74_25570 [Halieaceae bacterium]
MTDFHPALADTELANNDSRAVTINGNKVLICRAAGELYAVENRCTHQEAELEGGASAVVSFFPLTWRPV